MIMLKTKVSALSQAPCKGEIPRVQIEDLCEGCISLSNAEGLGLLSEKRMDGHSTLRTSF
uniref:hypothetical protein n=1 Tax=Eubacterium sp. TaxID=142586 RepID=UPI0040250135